MGAGVVDMAEESKSDRVFVGCMLLLFAVSSAATAIWCRSMSAMGTMHMPGGWAMSMVWMRMPGQSWPGAAASFTGMWTVMMTAMMSPSIVPVLFQYRHNMERAKGRRRCLNTAIVGLGYLLVWTAWGIVLFSLGAALAQLEMQRPGLSRVVPVIIPVIVLLAGVVQCSGWKMRQLEGCRHAEGGRVAGPGAKGAILHGLGFGLRCSLSCANLTAILVALGAMDLPAMVFVTALITVERLGPYDGRGAHATGIGIIAMGVVIAVRTMLSA
jgi:predicted metal-binding membrane protein